MKIGIVGLGSVGGFLGARLVRSGAQVSALARGATLAAVRARGLTLIEQNGASLTVPLTVSEDAAELGVQDLLVLTVKTTGLIDVAAQLAPMIGPETRILSAMNGIPWWFFDGFAGKRDKPLVSVDPNGELARRLPARQVIGCVTHLSCSSPQPGVVQQKMGERLIVGEPGGGDPELNVSCAASMAVLRKAGFQVEASQCIQEDIWYKLWGNMTVNPISAITGATGDLILDDADVKDYMSRCMLEAAQVGERIGLPIAMTPEERHVVTRKLGAFKTSMLQDVEAGRPIELDALLASVIEIGQRVNVATPNLQALMGLTRLTARGRGLYPQA
jgi:2-dehydropantoate 2-reductase